MSYLRGLVRKARAARPEVWPRLMPAAAGNLGFVEPIEEFILAPAHPGVRNGPADALSRAPPSGRSPAMPQDEKPAGRAAAPPAASADTASSPTLRAEAPPPVKQERASPAPVGDRIRTVRRSSQLRRSDDRTPIHGKPAIAADLDPRRLVRTRVSQPTEHDLPPSRTARGRPAMAASPLHQGEPLQPEVHISIGRVEVRAAAAVPDKPHRPQPFQPQLTLQDYLARRSRGPR
jgi:hypothetical protein